MKVILKKKSNSNFIFGDLNIGTVFTIPCSQNPNAVYMKINKGLTLNCISLESSDIRTTVINAGVITIEGAFVEGAE